MSKDHDHFLTFYQMISHHQASGKLFFFKNAIKMLVEY